MIAFDEEEPTAAEVHARVVAAVDASTPAPVEAAPTPPAPKTPRALLVELVASREGFRPFEWHELIAASGLDVLVACRALAVAVTDGALVLHRWQGRTFFRPGKDV